MKISVVIPAYNCEKFISKCLDSVLSQKGAELDVIVVNDGSTDNTGKILEKYKDKIRVVNKQNGGTSAAKNMGISLIEGDYTMFLDSDDYLSENAIQILADTISKTDADIVKFRYQLVFPDGTVKAAYNQFEKYEFIEKKDFKEKIYPHFINGIRLNSVWSGIYRSSLIKGREFRTDMRVAEDAVFSLKSYTDAKNIVVIEDVLYNYYQTGRGLTGNAASVIEKYKCNCLFASETLKYLKEWDMDSFGTRVRVCLRPAVLTLDKIRRIIQSKV